MSERVRVLHTTTRQPEDGPAVTRTDVLFSGSAAAYDIWRRWHVALPGFTVERVTRPLAFDEPGRPPVDLDKREPTKPTREAMLAQTMAGQPAASSGRLR